MAFITRHLGNNQNKILKMLSSMKGNWRSVDHLVQRVIPNNIKLEYKNNFPAITEDEAIINMRNTFNYTKPSKKYALGMDFNETILPPVIARNLLENPKWYTAYTPYQAEISQGRMESLFNFQTLICELTDLPISNCSLLDSASAATEAFNIAFNAHKGKRKVFFCDNMVHPVLKATLETRANLIDAQIVYGNIFDYEFVKSNNLFCGVLFSYPNVRGDVLINKQKIDDIKSTGALIATHNDIMNLMITTPPGQIGADISFGTTQRFGLPLWNGGPHSAFFATTEKLLRMVPGRIVGLSKCRNGNDAYRLALQTREQHIKKERALSNICTSQALLANTSAMYAIYHGKENLYNMAVDINTKRNLLFNILSKLRSRLIMLTSDDNDKDIFSFDQVSFTTKSNINNLVQNRLNNSGFSVYTTNFNNDVNNFDNFNTAICISIGETISLEDIYTIYINIAHTTGNNYLELLSKEEIFKMYDEELERNRNRLNSYEIPFSRPITKNNISTDKPFLYQDIFSEEKSETWMLRYIHKLADKDYSLATGMIPLGSCTMKLNSTTEMTPLSWNELQNLHPFCQVSEKERESYDNMISQLTNRLKDITGFDAFNYQSNSGAMGELSGLSVIKKYHSENSEKTRDTILIPESAHGTNFSSARLAGFKIKKFDDTQDINNFKEVCNSLGDKLAGLMITYPTTYGLFNRDIKEICDTIHELGGLVYMDGANMNAQCGLTSPRICGADICHLNLHKTFCIPHGGGGPGMGPIGVVKELKKYLPSNPLLATENCGDKINSYGSLTMSPNASASILSIPLLYMQTVGSEGLKLASEQAILNANYLKDRLEDHYTIFKANDEDFVGHEFIINLEEFGKFNISDKDIAKRLIDYNFHPPTMSWPVSKSIMIEPTESENLEELDRFIEAMINIKNEINEIKDGKFTQDNNPLVNAPHSLDDISDWKFPYSTDKAFYPVESLKDNKLFPTRSRVDDIYGDRNLKVSRDK
jgi:glycine dehydrogenase